MRKTYYVTLSLVSIFLFINKAYSEGSERKIDVRALSDVESYDEQTLNNIFDGSNKNSVKISIDISNNYFNKTSQNNYGISYNKKIIPEPLINNVTDEILLQSKVIVNGTPDEKEKNIIDKAFNLIRDSSENGKELYSLKDKIQIFWKEENENLRAQAIPPTSFLFFKSGPKIILNAKFKDIYMSNPSVPAYLAIILAHELSHHKDFQDVGNTNKNVALKYISEEKAYLTQIQTYEVMIKKYPYLFDESKIKYDKILDFISEQRFFKAVWDYKNNGGKKINKSDFPYIKNFNENWNEVFNYDNGYIEDLNFNPYTEWLDFRGVYSFHGFISIVYNINDRDIYYSGLKYKNISDDFNKIRDSAKIKYKEYCKDRGMTPLSDGHLDKIPDPIDYYSLEDTINNAGEHSGEHNHHGEINITPPGPPPYPHDADVNWDGR